MGRGRLITAWLSRVLVASLVITSLILGPAKPAAAATGDPFRFIYDQSGRLVAAVTPTDVAKYTYDAVGNITAITRSLTTTVAVIEFAPHSGAVGTTVTVYGSGFSATSSQNTVKFNGVTATVTSSTTTQIVTTVPTGATSGTISVTAPGGTSTSSASFAVANLAPTITGFSPGTGVRGSSVIVTGTNFDTVLTSNNVRLNSSWAKVTAATATSLTFQVPPASSSGPVSVATVNGKATGADFIIPPGTYTAADIGQSQRIDPGSSGTATVSTAGKISLVLFAATAGQRVSINAVAAQNVGAIDFSIISPDGSTLWGPVTSTGSSIFTDALTVLSGGTQTLLIDPQGTLTDSWTVSVYALPADFTAAITPTQSGVATAVAITVPGQNGHLTFTGTTGQRVSVTSTFASWTLWINVTNPDGTYAFNPQNPNGDVWTDLVTLTQTGTYSINLDPVAAFTGSRTFTVYDVPSDFTAPVSPTPAGASVNVSITTPGQNGHLTFSGTTGGRVSILSYSASWPLWFSIRNPDGSYAYGPAGQFNGTVWLDPVALTQTGTYTVDIDPQGSGTGSRTFTVYDVPADSTTAVTPTQSGASTIVDITPGQNAHLTFAGTPGQRLSLNSNSQSWSIWLSIRNPDGTYVYGPAGQFNGNFYLDPVSLTQTGTYTVDIDPQGELAGPRTFTLYDVPADFTAPITIGGSPVTVAIVTPGQNATLTFSASIGQRVSVSSVAVWSTVLGIRNPDNSYVYGPYVFNGNVATGTISLSQNGTYVIELDPISNGTGNQDFTLGDQGFGGLPIEIARAELPLARSGGADPATTRNAAGLMEPQAKDGPDGDDEWRPDPANPRTWVTNRPDSVVRRETSLYAANGVTALSGQVLALNGHALEGVEVAIGKIEATTDRNGMFLLSPLSSGHGVMIVNGTQEKANKKNYGMFEIGVEVADGRTNVLPFTIWLPRIDDANAVAVPSPTKGETIIRTPSIPGLELHIPAGSTVKDMNGDPVTSISLTAIPLDRTPFPLPKFENIPIYFTAQPGCAYVLPKGAQIWYPNYTHLPAGTRVNFWSYDPDKDGWHIYGHGAVTEDESQVRPDADTFIYEFTGAMFSTPFTPPDWWPAVADFFTGGDPVDLGSGLFVMDHTDLALPDVTPISLTRTYRQNDTNNRGWGPGWSHPYFVYLWSAQQYQQVDLILPDGGRVHYVRTSPGTGWADAVFEHTGTPSAFYKSHIVWNGTGWDLTLKDGTKLVFLDNGPLTLVVDRYGNRTSLVRLGPDPKGNIDVIRSSNGRWIQLTYDAINRITRAEDNSGRAVTYDYTAADATGKLWKVHDAAGGITEYGYDANGRLRTIKDPKLLTYLTVDYDANGRVQKQTQADTTTFQFAYTVVNGKVTQTDVTDPRTFVRRVTFNGAGYGLTDTAALGQTVAETVSYERDPTSNLVLSATDPRSRVTRNTYYPAGDLWTTTNLYGTADAVTRTFTYESKYSQLASVTDPLMHTTTFGYDTSFNRISEADALQHAATFSYYGSGQLQTATDALQKTTTFVYDAGDLVTATDSLGRLTRRFSDAIGRPLAMTDALGNRVRTDYDALNRVTKVTDPNGNATQFTYDANGNRLTVKDAKNNVTTYTYDNMDRVATRKDALLKIETYNSYDADGNLLLVTDRKGQVTEFRYDALDRQLFAGYGRTGTSPNFSYQSTINYSYDNANRLYQTQDSGSGTITRGYDELDRLTSEVTPQGTVGYQYDTASRRTQLTVSGQSAVAYGYDNADRLSSITQGSIVIGLGYDNANRRTTATLPGSLGVAYVYDDASQLLSTTFSQSGSTIGTLAYTYDPAGRRTTSSGTYARLSLPAAVSTATYNANNQLTKWGNTNIGYDLNGNMTGDGTNTYNWNARDQMSAVTKSGQTLPAFTYDAFARRQKKTVGSTVTSYVYDGANTVQELTGSTVTANLLTGLSVDELFQRTEGSTIRTFLSDALGGTLALADSAGVVQTSYTYAPYGETTVTGTASNNRTQYAGRESDNDGLYFYRGRYYHPVFSRFVSEDPIRFGGGTANLYEYAHSSPTNFTDPSGTIVPWVGACAAGAAFSVIFDMAANSLSGRKNGIRGALGSAASGCVSSLVGLGLGAVIGRGVAAIAGRIIAATAKAAPNFASRLVVIGESTPRVRAIAQALNGISYEPVVLLPGWVPRAVKIWMNERWLASQIKAGALILDIGPDFERRLIQGASEYYLAELRLAERMSADVLSIPFRELAGLLFKP